MAPELLERDREFVLIRDALEAAAVGTGAVVVVDGPAGIGKSRLLATAVDLASERGFAIVSARAGELEQDLPWSIVRDLFGATLARATASERERLLAGAARRSVVILDGADGDPAGADATTVAAVMHSLYWLAANMADRAPLLIAVDDVQWSDTPSLRWLAYLAARIDGLRVLVITAVRTGEERAPDPLVRALRGHAGGRSLAPAPLSTEGVAILIRGTLGREAEDGFCAACHAATAGNPFLLRELVLHVRRERLAPTAANAERVAELQPAAVAEAVLARLAGAGEAAARVAEAVAILGTDAGVPETAELARLDEAQVRTAADELAAREVLSPGTPLEFLHPLVRNAVRAGVSPLRSQELHGRAARILAGRGAPADEIAVHLLQTERQGDGWVTDRLHQAALAALDRGAPALAATYIARALQECPEHQDRLAMLRALGAAEVREHGARGLSAFEEALDLASEPDVRAGVALELARELNMLGDPVGAARLLGTVVDELDERSTDAAEVEGLFVFGAMLDDSLRPAIAPHVARLAQRVKAGEQVHRTSLANLALLNVTAGASRDRALALARASLDGAERSGVHSMVLGAAALVLVWLERIEEALAVLDDVIDNARGRGHLVQYASAGCWRSHAHHRAGALAEAEADARTSLSLYQELGVHPPEIHAFLVDALLERGDPAEADERLRAAGLDGPAPAHWYGTWLLESRARLRLRQGDARAAHADALECGRRLREASSTNPIVIPWRSTAALALHHLGDDDEALLMAGEELEAARAFGVATGVGVAQRVKGLILGGVDGRALLAAAAETLAPSPARLEHARALVELGAALRRAGLTRDALAQLRAGLDLATACGATTLGERAREELIAAGARPRRDRITGRDALTASELRVARMAADGMTNREIAQALFLTRRTVETHLTHVYAKLGIEARTGLPSALAEQAVSL